MPCFRDLIPAKGAEVGCKRGGWTVFLIEGMNLAVGGGGGWCVWVGKSSASPILANLRLALNEQPVCQY